ncbi:hypothetical protein DPMN_062506 [Dreissena polymorpha]|uniref:Uncharacterized protein n=1 Tax=Dreissena polymorpha TaxID=45954 RepID=A0A9D4C9S0_DREPO|nr:hypothetical protein DPMN_062506 [Dreissena polymorpha]
MAPPSRSSVYFLCQCDSVYLAKVPHGTTFTVKCLLSMLVRLGVHGQGTSRHHLYGQVSIDYACATRCTWPRYLTAPPSRSSVYCLCLCDSVYMAKVPHVTTITVKCLLSMSVRLGVPGQGTSWHLPHGQGQHHLLDGHGDTDGCHHAGCAGHYLQVGP